MIKLLTIIGARPQIIKAAAISRAVNESFSGKIEEKILDTGQHYDANMSRVFFEELNIPRPDFNLGVGSASHGEQTAKMIVGIEKILLEKPFDGIILYGDTNSTLAGAVAASKVRLPVFHIEAGLRLYDMSVPEEINRIVCDHLSSILFAPTKTGYDNLMKEGFQESVVFRGGKRRIVYNSGDVMYDNSLYFASLADKKCDILSSLGLKDQEYILATLHRDNNTDDSKRLNAIFEALLDISANNKMKVILPLHPRTKKMLGINLQAATLDRLNRSEGLLLLPPVTFFEMIELEKHAKIVMTDSGGVQKEAFFYSKPCVIFLHTTPWPEIIDNNAGILADADRNKIIEAYNALVHRKVVFPKLFGDGCAAHFVLNRIVEYLS